MITYTIDRDRNGNKVCRVKNGRSRAFSIQTNGNLPETHNRGVCAATLYEVPDYVNAYGTPAQKAALNLK